MKQYDSLTFTEKAMAGIDKIIVQKQPKRTLKMHSPIDNTK